MNRAIPVILFFLSAAALLALSFATHTHHQALVAQSTQQSAQIGNELSETKVANYRMATKSINPNVIAMDKPYVEQAEAKAKSNDALAEKNAQDKIAAAHQTQDQDDANYMLWTRIAISAVVLALAIWMVLNKTTNPDSFKWATGMIGMIVGYWLKT